MERMKRIAELQNELYDRILIQYYTPLKIYIHAKSKGPDKVTLAEHARLYKLSKLMETLSKSCQVHNKIVYWYSAVSVELSKDFNNSLQRTLNDMEQATIAINNHWAPVAAMDGDSVKDSPSPAQKFGLDPVKSTVTASRSVLTVDMTTIEARITNLHTSLETALTSLKHMINTAQKEHVPLSNLDLSESDLSSILIKFPLPYLKGSGISTT